MRVGSADNLVTKKGKENKEIIGLGGRKSGGDNAIDADINARISCIKGYTLMWRQQIPDDGTSGLEGGKITIGGTYQYTYGVNSNRPYLICNPTDTAAEDVIDGVTVAAGWSVIRVGTEQEVAFAAGWKLIDLLLTFGTAKGHELGSKTTADVAEAMGYVATESGKAAFDAWQAHTEQFAADMAYSDKTVIRNGRWDGLRSVGKDGDGNAFDFTRSIEQIRRQYFPDGMNGIGIGTSSEVCDTIEAGQVVRRVGVKVFDGTESWPKKSEKEYFTLINPFNDPKKANDINMISQCYVKTTANDMWLNHNNGTFAYNNTYWSSTKQITFRDDRFTSVSAWKSHLAELYAAGTPLVVYYELDTPIITPLTELNLTYPVSNTEGTETPVCEPSTNCSPMAGNIVYGLDYPATINNLLDRVKTLEGKVG